jgi:hypothetical protein
MFNIDSTVCTLFGLYLVLYDILQQDQEGGEEGRQVLVVNGASHDGMNPFHKGQRAAAN